MSVQSAAVNGARMSSSEWIGCECCGLVSAFSTGAGDRPGADAPAQHCPRCGHTLHWRKPMNSAGASSPVMAAITATAGSPSSHEAEIAIGNVAVSSVPCSRRVMISVKLAIRNTTRAVTFSANSACSPSRWPRPSTASQRTQRATALGVRSSQRWTLPQRSQTISEGSVRDISGLSLLCKLDGRAGSWARLARRAGRDTALCRLRTTMGTPIARRGPEESAQARAALCFNLDSQGNGGSPT